MAWSQDCYVPDIDVIKFDIVSDTNLDVVDVNNNYLKKAEYITKGAVWPNIIDAAKVWDQGYNIGAGTKYFRQEFVIIGEPIYGFLITGCDDYITTIINDVNINCGAGNYDVLVSCDVLRFLKPGFNYIRFACHNNGSQGYFAYKLSIESRI